MATDTGARSRAVAGGDELDASRSRARSIDETEARARSPRDVVVTFRPSQIHRSTSNIALFFTGRSLTPNSRPRSGADRDLCHETNNDRGGSSLATAP